MGAHLTLPKSHDLIHDMENRFLTGIVQSGGPANPHPIANAVVTVFEATLQDPSLVGQARTDGEGRFELHMERDKSDGIFYVTATVDQDIELVTIIGLALRNTASITINELTTVAAAFSMAQFTQNGVIGGDAFGLRIASQMNDNLASPRSGASSEVLLNSPNGDETNSLRSTRSLANLVATCILKVPHAVKDLFVLTTPPYGGAPPTNTFQALVNIARYPANNVAGIYAQSQAVDVYSPALESMPEAWTLAVKVNDTGSDEMLFGGPGNIAFDDRGYAWISNNVVQGTPNSCRFAVVLRPNGKPADGTTSTPWDDPGGLPKSPLRGGGLLGGGFGVTIDTHQYVWFGNFGWGTEDHWPADGGVSVFNPAGVPLSREAEGFIGGTWRVQATVSDEHNNIWNASFGNSQVVVFLKGDPRQSLPAPVKEGYSPFGIAIAGDGSAWVTSSKGLYEYVDGNVSRYRIDLENSELSCEFSQPLGRGLKGLSIDSKGNIWTASGGEDAVYMLDSAGNQLGKFKGGGINGPWGTTIDGDDNVWVANFGQMLSGADYTAGAISRLAGADPDTRPPGFETGDPISPPSGYTLPSAGSPVLLHNGEPLYGAGGDPCYSPIMRQTSCAIDQAGNVWVVNNWKPNFDSDVSPETGNPGGDGIVIFVGLAKPPARR